MSKVTLLRPNLRPLRHQRAPAHSRRRVVCAVHVMVLQNCVLVAAVVCRCCDDGGGRGDGGGFDDGHGFAFLDAYGCCGGLCGEKGEEGGGYDDELHCLGVFCDGCVIDG